MSDRVSFVCNGEPVVVEVEAGDSLLTVLREQIGIVSVKDGCAPQGQCGCCTVLVDGDPRVACVTPVGRVAGREVVTVDGLEVDERDGLAAALVATGGSQCGFCTPGIVVRMAAVRRKGRSSRAEVERALAAHLCRCTGWQTIVEAVAGDVEHAAVGYPERDLTAASRRAGLEGGQAQRVASDVPLGRGGFADDTAPRDARVAVPAAPGCTSAVVTAAGVDWVVADTLVAARAAAGKVQGRHNPSASGAPFAAPAAPDGGVALATGWVEPAYLEPDASWCAPGGDPASPLANAGAFGGKEESRAPAAARELADALGCPVRVLLSREDTVRIGPKRPPIAAAAVVRNDDVTIDGVVARGGAAAFGAVTCLPYRLNLRAQWAERDVVGPAVSARLRGVGIAEVAVLVEGALTAAGRDRRDLVDGADTASVLMDTCVRVPSGACAGARVRVDEHTGAVVGVDVRVVAGDVLDDVVLRSYAVGAAHMALGWVLSEGVAVDSDTGEVQDLTIRSFGILRARSTPSITVAIVDGSGPPRARSSDAVFGAVAAAAWNAISAADGVRPDRFPARDSRAALAARR